jgi:5-methylcytosine-specific restriction endonuclease McrA
VQSTIRIVKTFCNLTCSLCVHCPYGVILPRSRGGKDEWGNLVWSDKAVNAKKGSRLPHEAGLKLIAVPRAPKALPVTTLIRNARSSTGLRWLSP